MDRRDVSPRGDATEEWLAAADEPQVRSLLGTLVQSSPLGIALLDGDLRFVVVNEALAECNGVPVSEHIGRSLSEVVPDIAADAARAFERVLATGEPLVGLELEGETAAQPGVIRHWTESVYRIRLGDGAFGVAAIVSETTDQWRSERRVRRVIDALGGFVGLLAPDGTVLEANGEALGASGLTAADVVGQPLWDTVWWKHDPEHRDRLMAGVREAAAGRPVRFDAVVQVGDRFVTLDLHLAPLEENEAVVAVVASGEDISQRRSATRRLRSLGEYSQALAVAETSAEVAEAVLRHVPQAIDADFVTLALRDDRDETLVFIHPPSLSPELAARYTRLPLDTRAPLTDAVRSGSMVIVRDNEENRRRYPELIDDAVEAGLASVAAAPLVIEDEVVGAIGFGWARPLRDEDFMESRLMVVSELTAQTLQRTRTADARARLIDELRQHLVPTQPDQPTLEIAVRYQAAGRSIGFGGDWYDVIALDDGRTAVIVGDVVGHGISAAARMAVLKTVLSTVVRMGTPLDRVFDEAEPMVRHLDAAFLGSALIIVVDPPRGLLTHSSAGHPPLLIKPPGEDTRTLEGGRRPVLGAHLLGCAAETVPVAPGTVVVAYTDGLIEGRREHLDTALARVAGLLDASIEGRTCEEIADAVLATAGSSADLTDDVVLVVMRTASAVPGPTLAAELPRADGRR